MVSFQRRSMNKARSIQFMFDSDPEGSNPAKRSRPLTVAGAASELTLHQAGRHKSDRRIAQNRLIARAKRISESHLNGATFVGILGANPYRAVSLNERDRISENHCATSIWRVSRETECHPLKNRCQKCIQVVATVRSRSAPSIKSALFGLGQHLTRTLSETCPRSARVNARFVSGFTAEGA
jgi:hypothetical protein